MANWVPSESTFRRHKAPSDALAYRFPESMKPPITLDRNQLPREVPGMTLDPRPPTEDRQRPVPPKAEQRPHSSTHHGVTIDDPWHWLRDPSYPNVEDADILAYLNAENEYFEASMAPHRGLVDVIFQEIKARQQPDLSSVPWRRGNWFYQWSFQEGSQYRVWQRWPSDTPDAREAPPPDAQTILDEPGLAEGVEYFRLGSMTVNNRGNLLAYSADTDGSERFTMVIKDLESGELLQDEIKGTMGGAVWAADDESFFYTLVDANWRPWQVRRHVIGQPVGQDSVAYEETDPGFFVGLSLTTSREFVLIGAGRPRDLGGATRSRSRPGIPSFAGLSPADGA